MKFECAFIYVAPGCNPAKERAVVEGDSINMNVIGCATYAEAEEIAKEMVAKGWLVEKPDGRFITDAGRRAIG